MGITSVTIDVANPATPRAGEPVDFLVDSGAVYSVVQSRVLERLGIARIGREEYRLANGEKIHRDKGIAAFQYGERIGGADVIFGEEGDMDLVGATTLESLGLSFDPLRRELKPLPMLLA